MPRASRRARRSPCSRARRSHPRTDSRLAASADHSADQSTRWAAVALFVVLALALAEQANGASWPLHPRHGLHPVRAGILDPVGSEACFAEGVALPVEERACHFHAGLDIVTDERTCSSQAPAGRCQRLFAVEAGRVWRKVNRDLPDKCSGLAHVGRFTYGHVDVRRRLGRWVREGQPIGWTCSGWHHIHLGELPRGFNKRRAGPARLNPIRPGGPLDNFNTADHEAPLLLDFRYVGGELWGRIEDPVPAVGLEGIARLGDRLHPYSVSVNGRLLWTARRAPHLATWSVYAPPAYRNRTAPACGADVEGASCTGERWFRLGYHEPGALVTVRAVDAAWNAAETIVQTPTG